MAQIRRRSGGSPAPARKTSRRWQVPPPLTHGPESLEAGGILLEGSAETGPLLWQAARDILLWSGAPAASWHGVFAPYAYARRTAMIHTTILEPAVAAPLVELSGVLRNADIDPIVVVGACRKISNWAEQHGLYATALAFSQVVAIIRLTDADAALAVGALARRTAEHARAESWLRRAIMLARQSGDWASYTIAFLKLGNLFIHRGNFPIARKLLVRAQRTAHRHGLRELEGMALHDLCTIAIDSGESAEAEALAAAALGAYGIRNPRLPALAHDVAYLWLEQGRFVRALSVFEAVLPHMVRPADRVHTLADIARAAAGASRRERFEWAWSAAADALKNAEAIEEAAQALVDLAHGAAMLRDWERAYDTARQALQLATVRNEGKVRLTAESILDLVKSRRTLRPESVARQDGVGEELATEFLERLAVVDSAGCSGVA